MTTKAWLDFVYYKLGRQQTNYRLCSTYTVGDEVRFSRHLNYLDVQAEPDLEFANQREQLSNEIVFDLDDSTPEEYQKLIATLKADKMKFYAYSTSEGRARHIHTFWDQGFSRLDKNEKWRFRSALLNQYKCDPAYSTGSGKLVPIEFAPHWKSSHSSPEMVKTGKIKELIASNPGVNSYSKWKKLASEWWEDQQSVKEIIAAMMGDRLKEEKHDV